MKNITNLFLLAIVLSLALNSCGPRPAPVTTPVSLTGTSAPSTPTSVPPTLPPIPPTPTITPFPKGKTIVVTSAKDSGPETFRQALLDAGPGDVITFDPAVFPPKDPAVITLLSPLEYVGQGSLTIDASDAGMILDGSKVGGEWTPGIGINSSNNVIKSLHIVYFPGPGIGIGNGQNNLIEGNIVGNNNYGISLSGTDNSDNQIKGNFVGVLADGITPQGNTSAGIIVNQGAHHNFIGPNNHIAFNEHNGVEILNAVTVGNKIFENSIHDNGQDGINLYEAGNGNLVAPILMDFDLASGSVDGLTCPNCEVMVYSDPEKEGTQYEGRTVADDQGVFSLEKGSAFSGPVLTATATDEQGNTSSFSLPTIGSRRSMKLQAGNSRPRITLATKPTDELEDNRLCGGQLGSLWEDLDYEELIENETVPMGSKRFRLSINEVEYGAHLDWSKPELSIPTEQDNVLTEFVSHGITIYYVLSFWDKANHPNGWEVRSRFKTEEELSRYLEYVRFIVSHFKGRVHYYELWNEPDVTYPLQYIEPADYINLAKRTIPVIKQLDPEAKVIVGATSGLAAPESREYLFKVLNSDVMPIADVVSWHPLYDNTPDAGKYPDYYASYPSLLARIMDTAKQHGFHGEFIAEEINYEGGPDCDYCDVVDPIFSEVVLSKYTARGIVLHLGNDVSAGAAGTSTYTRPVHYKTIRNIASVFAGTRPEEFAVEVQTESKNFKVFTFARTDGSNLVTLWTDGMAVDDDPGFPSTLTIPGFAGWNAAGVDILNGFEQELITSSENGDLIVCDFLIKDYPIIIRLIR